MKPASPILFYGTILLFVLFSGYYIISKKFEYTEVKDGTIACYDKGTYVAGKKILHQKTNIPTIINLSGTVNFEDSFNWGRNIAHIKYYVEYKILEDWPCRYFNNNDAVKKEVIKRAYKGTMYRLDSQNRVNFWEKGRGLFIDVKTNIEYERKKHKRKRKK